MSATLISDRGKFLLLSRLCRSILGVLPVLALLFAVSAVSVQAAGEEDSGAGFFQYLPATPKLKLPDIDIIPFWTDDFKRARKAYNNGNYSRAMKFFRRASDDGNIVADWYLAHMFRLGQGTTRDPAIAYSYYTRVADNFDPEEPDTTRLRIMIDSQLQIAKFQRDGIPLAGLEANPAAAARAFLRIASSYGHPGAQFEFAVMNIVGEGVKKNPQQGLKWLTAAARKRHTEAQAYLGDLYWQGRFVKQSETRGLMWYILANQTARPEEHSRIINRFNEMESIVDAETKLEAEARARVWNEQYPATLARAQ